MTKAERELFLKMAEGVRLVLMAQSGQASNYMLADKAGEISECTKAVRAEQQEDQHG